MSIREHLTTVEGGGLKPKNILDAAAADIILAERKKKGEAALDRRYSFMQRHVRRARTVPHLIALAFFEPLPTNKVSTYHIYRDELLLLDTLIDELLSLRKHLKAEKELP